MINCPLQTRSPICAIWKADADRAELTTFRVPDLAYLTTHNSRPVDVGWGDKVILIVLLALKGVIAWRASALLPPKIKHSKSVTISPIHCQHTTDIVSGSIFVSYIHLCSIIFERNRKLPSFKHGRRDTVHYPHPEERLYRVWGYDHGIQVWITRPSGYHQGCRTQDLECSSSSAKLQCKLSIRLE